MILSASLLASAQSTTPPTLPSIADLGSLNPAQPDSLFSKISLNPKKQYQISLMRKHSYGYTDRVTFVSFTSRAPAGGVHDPEGAQMTRHYQLLTSQPPTTQEKKRFSSRYLLKLLAERTISALPSDLQPIAKALFAPPAPAQALDQVVIKVVESGNPSATPTYYKYNFSDFSDQVTVSSLLETYNVAGSLYVPKNINRKLPVVILLGGSGGSYDIPTAYDIASRGAAVMGVNYFTFDPADPGIASGALTLYLAQVPLEIFGRAIAVAKSLPFAEPNNLVVMGGSYGGQAAMLIAKYLARGSDNQNQIRTIIPLRPYDVNTGSGWNTFDVGGKEVGSWTLNKVDLPFAPLPVGKGQFDYVIDLAKAAGTYRVLNLYGTRLPAANTNRQAFESLGTPSEAIIDVSDFAGNVVSVTGEKDLMWPSPDALNRIKSSRSQRSDDRLVVAKGAGHYTWTGRTPFVLNEKWDAIIIDPTASVDSLTNIALLDGGDSFVGYNQFNVPYDLMVQQAYINAIFPGRTTTAPIPFKALQQ